MKKITNLLLTFVLIFVMSFAVIGPQAESAGSADEAISLYKAMVEEDPESVKAQSGLADAYINKYISTGKAKKVLLFRAKKAINKAEKIDNKSALPQISWAKYFMAMDLKERAIKRARKAAALAPDNSEAQKLLEELGVKVAKNQKPAPPAESRQAKASIKTIKVEHGVLHNNKKGMRIHIKVTVKGLKGRKSRISAYFYFRDGSKLKDLDGKLKSAGGQVSVGKKIIPPYESTRWDDFKLFIPYDQLHMKKGMQKLKFNIIVWNLSGSSSVKLAESEWVKFKYEERGILASISKVRVERSVYQNKKKGIKIHAILVVKGLKRKKVAISGYFYYKSGKKLKDHDGKYKTNDGQIAVSKKVNPKHDSSRWDDLSLFMPYDQLHLGKGKHDLKFYLLVWDRSGRTSIKLTQSEWYYFQFTK